jgi:WD40 repeat protein
MGPALQLPRDVWFMYPADLGKTVVIVDRTGKLHVLDLQTRAIRSIPVPGWPGTAGHMWFGADGHRAYIIGNEEAPSPTLAIVDLDTLTVTTAAWPPRTTPRPRPTEREVSFIDVSPDGGTLYTVDGPDLLVFDTTTMRPRRRIPQHSALRDRIAQTPNGRYLFLVTEDGELRVVEAATGSQVSSGRSGHEGRGVIDFDNGRKVAVYSGDGYDVFDTSAFAGS